MQSGHDQPGAVRPTGLAHRIETWIERPGASIWAAVHMPSDARASGVALLAPPLGLEGVGSHRALLTLAHELSSRGVLAIRFSWSGEGDSSPRPTSESRAQSYARDVESVTNLAHQILPGAPLTIVGLRVGAALVSGADADAFVLWEPMSGKAHLRSQEILRRVSIPVPTLDSATGIEICGEVVGEDETASIRSLRPPRSTPTRTVTKVVLEPDELHKFLGVPPMESVTPRSSLRQVADAVMMADPQDALPWTPVTATTFEVDGRLVTEELAEIGPHRLPGVITRPAAAIATAGLVFTAPGAEPRHAPIGLWSAIAREAAATTGALSMRADRRTIGEMTDPSLDRAAEVYSVEAVADVADTLRALGELIGERPTVAVGSCVGAWLHMRATAEVRPTAILGVENEAWFYDIDKAPRLVTETEPPGRVRALVGRLRSTPHAEEGQVLRQRLIGVFLRSKRILAVTLGFAAERVPGRAWRIAGRTGAVNDPYILLHRQPDSMRLRLVFGNQGGGRFRRSGGVSAVAALQKSQLRLEAVEDPLVDHSLFAARARQRIAAEVRHMLSLVAAPSIEGASAAKP